MLTVPKTAAAAPSMPAPLYGITPKPPQARDYISDIVWASLFAIFLAATIAICVFGESNGVKTFLVIAGLTVTGIGFISSFDDPGDHKYEANVEGNKRFMEWEQNVLIPFLEAKHGVKFAENSSFVCWGYPRVSQGRKSFEVKLNGINYREHSFHGDEERFWFPTLKEKGEVYLTKVTRPKGVIYEDLEEF